MSKPRILILENSIAVTGALKSVLRSSLYMREWYDYTFVLPSGSKAKDLVIQQGFDYHELPMKEIRKEITALVFYLPLLLLNTIRFARFVRKNNISLIVSNDFYNLIPPCYSIFGGKVNYVCYVRFLPSKFPPVLISLWHNLHKRLSSQIIAVSESVRRELPGNGKVVVVGNELPQMENVSFVLSTSKLILYPANYIKGKGHEYAVKSFAAIAEKYPEWMLRFVGGDMGLEKNRRFKESLMLMTKELGITDRIEFLGFVTDMHEQYMKASIVLNFSESESFSLTCLEGLFYGRTVIATDCGGPSEIIDHGQTGLIVPVGDVSSMQAAMDQLMRDPAMREFLATNGYTRIREKFSNTKVTDQINKIYAAALAK
jgi:glycosyltransferase involved in cell wall biosynthesis